METIELLHIIVLDYTLSSYYPVCRLLKVLYPSVLTISLIQHVMWDNKWVISYLSSFLMQLQCIICPSIRKIGWRLEAFRMQRQVQKKEKI